jgi:NhaP-type Na+/H+ or K+/H+ antiporter
MNLFEALIFTVCIMGVTLPLLIQFVETDREITREEEERKARTKYRTELNYWKDAALKSRTEITVICGGNETFSLENRR